MLMYPTRQLLRGKEEWGGDIRLVICVCAWVMSATGNFVCPRTDASRCRFRTASHRHRVYPAGGTVAHETNFNWSLQYTTTARALHAEKYDQSQLCNIIIEACIYAIFIICMFLDHPRFGLGFGSSIINTKTKNYLYIYILYYI